MRSLRKIWQGTQKLKTKQYVCSYCCLHIASESGYSYVNQVKGASFNLEEGNYVQNEPMGSAYICPNEQCNKLTFFMLNKDKRLERFPTPSLYKHVPHLPADVENAYREMCNCLTVNAFTSVVMWGRKIIMYIAIEQSAGDSKKLKEGATFAEYTRYLAKNRMPPHISDKWLKALKDMSNDANHRIKFSDRSQAVSAIEQIKLLLSNTYAYSAKQSKA